VLHRILRPSNKGLLQDLWGLHLYATKSSVGPILFDCAIEERTISAVAEGPADAAILQDS
jgi:hypothetical protein